MEVRVGAKLRVINPNKKVQAWVRGNLVVDNPDYYKKQHLGKSTWNTPRQIILYEKVGDEWRLPFGCLRDVYARSDSQDTWINEISDLRRFNYKSDIKPYEYQEKAILSALRAKNGVLVMPCGSGKTQCGLEVIARVEGRALWLTHTQDLLNQSKERAKNTLGEVGVGTITGGKVNIGNGITFATVQTLCKLDLSQYKDVWDIIIVDECQHCCGTPTRVTQFYKVVSNLSARYKIGLTATPKRADGLEVGIFALLGGIIHEVSKQEVAHTTCPIKVQKIETGWMPNFDCVLMSDGTINYHKVIDDMIGNAERFDTIFLQLMNLEYGAPTLVLANRVEYLTKMCEAYNKNQLGKAICLSSGKIAKEERKRALKALNDGELDCIFATYQLAKEGLDVPNLRYVVFATPEQDETTVVQAMGRVGRKADGKQFGTVLDFTDSFGLCRKWEKKRMRYYRKMEVEIL